MRGCGRGYARDRATARAGASAAQNTQKQSHAYAHENAHAHAHAHEQAHANAHAQVHAHQYSHARTRTHAQSPLARARARMQPKGGGPGWCVASIVQPAKRGPATRGRPRRTKRPSKTKRPQHSARPTPTPPQRRSPVRVGSTQRGMPPSNRPQGVSESAVWTMAWPDAVAGGGPGGGADPEQPGAAGQHHGRHPLLPQVRGETAWYLRSEARAPGT